MSGAVSRRIWKVTRMVSANHQSKLSICLMNKIPIEFTSMKVQIRFDIGVCVVG